jgi:exodeoxyribonuclease V alpha subunit
LEFNFSPDAAAARAEMPEWKRWERQALRLRLLQRADLLTIRDLREVSGWRNEAAEDDLALHALLMAMFACLNEGGLCLKFEVEALSARLGAFIDGTPDSPARARQIAGNIIARLPEAWLEFIGRPGDFKPLLFAARGGAAYLYFQRYYEYAEKLREHLARRAAASAGLYTEEEILQVKAALKTNPVLTQRGGKRAALVLTPGQEAALEHALRQNLTLISGGPGTGKTAVVVSILRCLARLGIDCARIRLAAPTGRAAYRLTEALRRDLANLDGNSKIPAPDRALLTLEAQTLHRLLQYRPATHSFAYHARNQLSADVLIIDEISMADAIMMSRVLEALPAGAKLVLLGDKDQLPSVEPGAVLADLLALAEFSGRSNCVLLEGSHRSTRAILDVAGEINRGVAELVFKTDGTRSAAQGNWGELAGCHWVDLTALNGMKGGWPAFLEAWSERQYLARPAGGESYRELIGQAAGLLDFSAPDEKRDTNLLSRIFEAIQRAQILTLLRRGAYGCEGLNARLCRALRRHLDPQAGEEYFAGMPVLIMRNAYGLNLFNGDVGVILKDRRGSYRAAFLRLALNGAGEPQKSGVFYALSVLPKYEAAFAITVHKSQGGEYEQILLVLPQELEAGEDANAGDSAFDLPVQRLLTREILYTGLTRAKHTALLCGTRAVISQAIKNKIER